MQLRPDQIKEFKELHQNHELDCYTDDEIIEIANGVVNIYLTLYREVRRRHPKEEGNSAVP